MARLLEHTVSPPAPCPYLRGQMSVYESRIMVQVEPDELEHLLARGQRRFGPIYFRPLCTSCSACTSVRVPTGSFVPSRSQRRVLRKCGHLRIGYGEPVCDEVRFDLYRRWHRSREVTRGWDPEPNDPEHYSQTFCFPHPSAREITYWLDERLVGVGLVDESAHALSAVYCYYDPELASLSLGTFNVLTLIQRAQVTGRAHVYLGYLVEDCASLRYKGSFLPQEVLTGRPALRDRPSWVPRGRADP